MKTMVVLKDRYIGAVLAVGVTKTENIDLTTRRKKTEISNITIKTGD